MELIFVAIFKMRTPPHYLLKGRVNGNVQTPSVATITEKLLGYICVEVNAGSIKKIVNLCEGDQEVFWSKLNSLSHICYVLIKDRYRDFRL